MRYIIGALIVMAIAVFGISTYLAPNDLSGCSDKPTEEIGCTKVDAIIAISGGDTNARTQEAIKLYKNGWANTLIFSGAAYDKSGPSNAAAMRKIAVNEGVPNDAIIVEEASETTKQNAAQLKEVLIKLDTNKVILVTSAYHQRRAGLEFNDRMDGMVKIINHPVPNDNQWNNFWWGTPIGWWLALGELFKIVAFYTGASR